MGRNKINIEKRRICRSITISQENFDKIEECDIKNVSKLIDWLLKEHFGKTTENVDFNKLYNKKTDS